MATKIEIRQDGNPLGHDCVMPECPGRKATHVTRFPETGDEEHLICLPCALRLVSKEGRLVVRIQFDGPNSLTIFWDSE